MDKKEINRLLEAHKSNSLTPQEQLELNRMLSSSSNSEIVKEWIAQSWENEKSPDLLSQEQSNTLYNDIRESTKATTRTSYLYKFGRITAAASILIAVLAGSYFWYTGQTKAKQENSIAQTRFTQDIEAPNINRARITLADGKVLYLDSLDKGLLPQQEGVEILKLDNGELQYKGTTQEIITNTLTNPRGSEIISIKLADGTAITLNAGSSITYPLSFSQDKREVKLTGEAYFNVVRHENRPFIVSVNNKAEVKVLGTQFNVKAYEDDSYASITLVEGSVEVAQNLGAQLGESHTLRPGEQASFDTEGVVVISKIDIDEFTAWKDNMFVFNDTPLESVMKSLERWYDLEVVFIDSGLEKIAFGGFISRKSNVSSVLNLMEMTGTVLFEISDNKIVVKRGKSLN